MRPARNQHTIAASCEVTGRGYWSGQHVRVVIHPGAVDSGITLVRSDLSGRPSCPAATTRTDAISFRTNLTCGKAKFTMVEHLLSALAGLEIDNAIVDIDAEELPGLDGSAQPFVEALRPAGLIIQAAAKPRLLITQRIRVGNNNGWIEVTPPKTRETYFEYQLDYGIDSPIPALTFGIDLNPHNYTQQVAPARTFVTADQAASLRASGVAAHVTDADLIVFGEDGPIRNELRFHDECARHKLLDLIGDLALTGTEIVGRVVSCRGGHVLNGMMAEKLHAIAANSAAREVRRRRTA